MVDTDDTRQMMDDEQYQGYGIRFQQQVQNPIRDNNNILWNKQSLGKKIQL